MNKLQQPLTNLQLTGQNDNHICYLSSGIGIHNEMKSAWLAMQSAANKAGINLAIASGYRSAQRQLEIWNNKYNGKPELKPNITQASIRLLKSMCFTGLIAIFFVLST